MLSKICCSSSALLKLNRSYPSFMQTVSLQNTIRKYTHQQNKQPEQTNSQQQVKITAEEPKTAATIATTNTTNITGDHLNSNNNTTKQQQQVSEQQLQTPTGNPFPDTVPSLSYLERTLPAKYHPYLKLGRYDKPIGYLLLFWPCAWGAALGQPLFAPLQLAHLVATFYFGSAVMRAAGCIVNDMWDRDFDNRVERTKERPLASGALSMKQAWIFLAIHLCGGLLTLTQLNAFSIALSFGIVPVAALYPLFKRITYYPQAVLGSCFNWGVVVGFGAAAGAINMHVALPAYLGGVVWTLIYDTIYAHQDKADDIKIGVKSTALAWGEHTKTIMQGLAAVQLGLFWYAGLSAGLGLPYFPACIAAHLYLWRLIQNFNMNDPKTCWQFFVLNKNFGLLLFLAIVLGKIFPKMIIEDEEEYEERLELRDSANKQKI